MNTTTEANPFGRSIGDFLCTHGSGPPSEDIDRPALADIKQDAALRAVVGLRRLGKPVTADAVASFDAEPRLVALTYRWTRHDALRRHLGRGSQGRPAMVRELVDDLQDLAQAEAIELVESDHAEELRRLSARGIDGLTLDRGRHLPNWPGPPPDHREQREPHVRLRRPYGLQVQ